MGSWTIQGCSLSSTGCPAQVTNTDVPPAQLLWLSVVVCCMYAASPQFNGSEKFRTLYNNFTNADGTQLISTTYSEQKWRDAAQACLEAINLAKDNGYNLYYATEGALNNTPEPKDLTQRTLRFTFIDKENTPEVIFADCRKETGNGIQGKSIPRWGSYCRGGLAITLRQIERFYTENGLPIDEDPKYP